MLILENVPGVLDQALVALLLRTVMYVIMSYSLA
jgi:hypothetical protein